MYSFSGEGANDVYTTLVERVMADGATVKPRGTVTKELHPAIIELTNPRHRLVTSYGRAVNVTFALAEFVWILLGRNDVGMLKFYNSTIDQFSDNGSTFNAAYGHRLRFAQGHDQIDDVIATLKADPDSRQATLQMWSSNLDLPIVRGKPNKTLDRACNMLSHLMIRDGALDWLQIVRSNDLIWGTPYNWMQFTQLQEYIARMLEVPVGRYVHVADSLHIYVDDTYYNVDAARIHPFDIYKHMDDHLPIEPIELSWLRGLELMVRSDHLNITDIKWSGVPAFWRSFLFMAAAHLQYKTGNDQRCYELLCLAPDRIYAAAQARFYWSMRWSRMTGLPAYYPWPIAVQAWVQTP